MEIEESSCETENSLYFSDIIGEAYKEWEPGDSIILDGGTGTGKTHFCTRILGEYAESKGKRVLYLCNRSKLKTEIEIEVSTHFLDKIFLIETYQSLQDKLLNDSEVPHCEYVIVDEAHYFTLDSYNDYTDLSWEYVRDDNPKAVVIYCSATARVFFDWLLNSQKVKKKNYFKIPKDYSYVQQVVFYKKDDLVDIIDNLLKSGDEKIIVFFQNSERLLEIYDQYDSYATVYCSKRTKNKKLKRLRSKRIKLNGELNARLLLTTSALDNGVSFFDRDLKYVISELTDIDAMIQCLGRKRSINPEDTCYFYIRSYDKRSLQGMVNMREFTFRLGKNYLENEKEFIAKYKNDRRLFRNHDIFYRGDTDKNQPCIMLNKMKLQYYQMRRSVLTKMIEKGYENVVQEYLGESISDRVSDYESVSKKNKKSEIIDMLNQNESKRLFAEDREKIADVLVALDTRSRSKGVTTLNRILDSQFPEYKCRFCTKDAEGDSLRETTKKQADGSNNPNHGKNYWVLTDDFRNYK